MDLMCCMIVQPGILKPILCDFFFYEKLVGIKKKNTLSFKLRFV